MVGWVDGWVGGSISMWVDWFIGLPVGWIGGSEKCSLATSEKTVH